MAGIGDKINGFKKDFLDNAALKQLDKKKIIGILFIALVLVFLDVKFFMSLQFKAISKSGLDFKKLNSEMENFQKQFSQSQKKSQSGPALTKEIISEAEIPLLLQDISAIANKNNIRILQLNPAKEVSEKKGAPVSEFRPNLISLEFVCDYSSLINFINQLENIPKFMSVEELRIDPNPDSVLQQNVNLVIKTYVKK